MEAERAAGRLPPEEIAALAALPRRPSWHDAQDAPSAARLARAQALFRASSAADPAGDWAGWAFPTAPPRGCPGPRR